MIHFIMSQGKLINPLETPLQAKYRGISEADLEELLKTLQAQEGQAMETTIRQEDTMSTTVPQYPGSATTMGTTTSPMQGESGDTSPYRSTSMMPARAKALRANSSSDTPTPHF